MALIRGKGKSQATYGCMAGDLALFSDKVLVSLAKHPSLKALSAERVLRYFA